MEPEESIPTFGAADLEPATRDLVRAVAGSGTLRLAVRLLHDRGALRAVRFSVAHDEFCHDAIVEIAGPRWLCLSTT